MSVVSWMVETADGFLVDAAESQFGAVASNTGTIVLLMVTLSLIGVCINMAFQFRSMDGASFFWYLIKLMLIGLFGVCCRTVLNPTLSSFRPPVLPCE